MCLIAFAYQVYPDFPLILIANRDEFYARPTRKAQFWTEEGYPDILAGKDLKADGTWFGLHIKKKKWAALTNHRDLTRIRENPPSRGSLVMDFLKSDLSSMDYLEKIRVNSERFNGFNLLVGDSSDLGHYCNENDLITKIQPGIHGVSNAFLNTPWTKLTNIKEALKQEINSNHLEASALYSLLTNEKKAEDTDLPETGLSPDMEKAVSSIFIKTQDYGTRCSSILLMNNNGSGEFRERRFEPRTDHIIDDQLFHF